MEVNLSDFMTLGLLIGLELVLGIDNILLISIVTGRLKSNEQEKARKLALFLALMFRLLLVMGAASLVKMTEPVFGQFSYKNLILLSGGAFLLFKAVKEIHHTVESPLAETQGAGSKKISFVSAIVQLVLIDMVFSIDSVITAVGLTEHLWVIITAVVLSFLVVLAFATTVANFVNQNPALKILALSFLVTIGVTLFLEGMGKEVEKGYIYLPMGFALVVELLQMRFDSNRRKTGGV
ncbi:MAG: TerC family protein [Bdellovibrionales bacterium]|nr:TerC family protein [Bdellovibrionales bacterium]